MASSNPVMQTNNSTPDLTHYSALRPPQSSTPNPDDSGQRRRQVDDSEDDAPVSKRQETDDAASMSPDDSSTTEPLSAQPTTTLPEPATVVETGPIEESRIQISTTAMSRLVDITNRNHEILSQNIVKSMLKMETSIAQRLDQHVQRLETNMMQRIEYHAASAEDRFQGLMARVAEFKTRQEARRQFAHDADMYHAQFALAATDAFKKDIENLTKDVGVLTEEIGSLSKDLREVIAGATQASIQESVADEEV